MHHWLLLLTLLCWPIFFSASKCQHVQASVFVLILFSIYVPILGDLIWFDSFKEHLSADDYPSTPGLDSTLKLQTHIYPLWVLIKISNLTYPNRIVSSHTVFPIIFDFLVPCNSFSSQSVSSEFDVILFPQHTITSYTLVKILPSKYMSHKSVPFPASLSQLLTDYYLLSPRLLQ